MFSTLSNRLGEVFDRLRKRGALTEADVVAAMREVRIALLEADVALSVVKDFVDRVRERAVGAEVLRSVTPGQMVIKIVNDQLVEMLGTEATELNVNVVPPVQVVITTGGTGISSRDQTYEVVTALLDKRIDGFGELFRSLSYQEIGAAAMLSRASAGTARGKILICVPGSENAVRLAMTKLVLPELGHLVREVRPSSRRDCPSSSGAASRTTSCWRWPRVVA